MMDEILQHLSEEDRARVKKFAAGVTVVIALLSVLIFWIGVDFLRESVYKHYFNPSRHVIVEQDPDTMEIYAWKDALGNVYNANDPDVKHFPYGVMVLILLILGGAVQSYNLLVEHYAVMLVVRSRVLQAESPRGRLLQTPSLE
ncbi:hypothetical protein GFC01_03410 [Desulfofundulus thermobenzoicus]|uniref:Uncharacterized protein n=1 Tax=Desulfofundulus thermobenzoicus TaxID=29376 RepID=A0A6N7IN17_9FIRM|nr:hypothetical protein [Desulfofundulus thermobenzoicus]MQL51324.1 hypothetical protein [Desulfofundulus thermobenzoicus]